ncbi:MAG: pseudaminic acid cytidylyltransferase [Cyclobacteriaceae bacterium]
MKRLALIPARGGSKRIKKKNIRNFLGKPIIAYSIDIAIRSNLFDTVMVSTDDSEIEKIAKNFGADVPFRRSSKNADDHATTPDVIEEVLTSYINTGELYDQICCIYPTAPLISIESLREGEKILNQGRYDSVFPVVQYSYPIQRSLKFSNEEKIIMAWPEYLESRSQDLENHYHDAGQFYWLKVKEFMKSKKVFSENASGIVLNELNVQDIDNLSDWEIAEFKYQFLNSGKAEKSFTQG